jgi:hypothetical protein
MHHQHTFRNGFRRLTAGVANVSLVVGLLVVAGFVTAANATAADASGVSFTLSGCRNNGTITLPDGSGNFLCPDAAYTSGNLGKGWNELDLVPARFELAAGNSAPTTQTYTFAVAVDNCTGTDGATGCTAAGDHPGYDLLGSDAPDHATPVINTNLSSGSCGTISTGPEQYAVNGGTSLYRLYTVAGQARNSDCYYDIYARLAIGSHLNPGSELHYNLLNEHLGTAGVGSKDVSIPVRAILPQQLSKDMSASQGANFVWGVVKTATPTALTISNTCDPSNAGPAGVQVTVTWTKSATAPGDITIITHVYATNPASRSITATAVDNVYAGSDQTTLLYTVTGSATLVPANSTSLVASDTRTVPAGTASAFNDVATATYTDAVTGVPIPQTTTATATATVQTTSTNGDTAVVTDVESITGAGFSFSTDSFTGASGSFDNGYVAGTATTGSVGWTSDTQNASGSVTFAKSVYAAMGSVGTGTLSDTATATFGGHTADASLNIDLSANTLVALTIDKTIPNVLQTGESATFQFTVTDSSNAVVATPSITFNAGDTEHTATVSGLAPGSYTVSETTATHWLPEQPVTVTVAGTSAAACSATVSIANNFGPAIAAVQKITVPAGDAAGWQFILTGPGTGASGEPGTTDANGQISFATQLQEGSYTVTEVPQAGWDQTSATGCSFTVNYPDDAGGIFTCTVTNTERGSLTAHKSVNWNGVTPDPSASFTLCITGPSYASPTLANGGCQNIGYLGGDLTWSNLLAGGYTVTESDPGTSWSVTGNNALVTVSPGANSGTTITNTRKLGSLSVTKVVDWSGAPAQSVTFTICITGPSYASPTLANGGCQTVGNTGGTLTWNNLLPGDYQVVEQSPGSAFTVAGNSVTLTVPSDGGNVSTTVTNTYHPGLVKVVKTVNGGAIAAGQSFTFQLRQGATVSAAGSILESRSATSTNGGVLNFTTLLIVGTHYQICEIVMPGWLTSLGPNAFVPNSLNNPNVDNSVLCADFVATAGPTPFTFSVDNTPPPGGRALTIGFWKNWASCSSSNGSRKPVLDQTLALADPLVVAATSGSYPAFAPMFYLVLHAGDCTKAVDLLNKSTFSGKKMASDPAFNLAAQLVAAELNYTAGAGQKPSVTLAITRAVLILGKYGFNGSTHGKISSTDANTMNSLATTLDNYNNNI